MSLFKTAKDAPANLPWDPEAEERLVRLPFFVRPMVRKKVEERVRSAGGSLVDLAAFSEAEARFRAVMGGKSEEELKALLPAENRPGVEMAVLAACRSSLSGCPNPLVEVDDWRAVVEDWLKEEDVSGRLRSRVSEDQILYHHKLSLCVCGCPNGCSRPQIADLALVGALTPQFDPEACTACGACIEACPDEALSPGGDGLPVRDESLCQGCLACSRACAAGAMTPGPSRVRVLAGGKLGRHPRLAQTVLETSDPGEVRDFFSRTVNRYMEEARPGERFGAWWGRSGVQGKAGGPD